MSKSSPGWGGKREGSGRPKRKDLGEKEVQKLVKAFEQEGKLSGTTAGKELARLAFRSENDNCRLKALQIFYNVLAARKQDSDPGTGFRGPTIYLPEIMEPPPEYGNTTTGMQDDAGEKRH